MQLALYQPDIPQNTGTLLRMGACFDVPVHIIEPAGFIMTDKSLRRAGMDYLEHTQLHRHKNWQSFYELMQQQKRRILLLTTQAHTPYTDFSFNTQDVLMLGRESAGVPQQVHEQADATLIIPMRPHMRSLNIALAGAIALAEGLRQTGGFPHIPTSKGTDK